MPSFAIRAESLSKQYKIESFRYRHNTLRDQLMDRCKLLVGRNARPQMRKQGLWALNDVSFEAGKGEMLGIIGRNGAGKSTLLKILSRVTQPTRGRAEINGRLGSLLEVGTGFSWELSGRENIFLSAAIIGMSRKEIRKKFDQIVSFAEIGRHIDTPVKRYSSGMYMRLAFSVASHLDPDILLIDEVLAVGDVSFQRKCMEHVKSLRDRTSTVLIVSHNMFSIKALCDRVIYLSEGQVRFDGSAEAAIELYEQETRQHVAESKLSILPWARSTLDADIAQCPIYITYVELFDESWNSRHTFEYGEKMRIRLHFKSSNGVLSPNFNVAFIRSDNVACCNYNNAMDGFIIPSLQGTGIIELVTPPLKLVAERYDMHLLIWDSQYQQLYSAQTGPSFHIRHDLLSPHYGVFYEKGQWDLHATLGQPEERRILESTDVMADEDVRA